MNELDSREIRFGPYEVDLASGELRKNGKRLPLQEQPFQVLAALLERPGDVVTRDYLRERLWPGQPFVDSDQGLNTAINKLRDALGDSAANPRYIETAPRRGYRFSSTLEPSTEPSTDPGPIVEKPAAVFAAPPGKRLQRIGLMAMGAIALGGAGTWLWVRQPAAAPQVPLRRFVLRTPLATRNALKRSTAISPDGKQIAFVNGEGAGRLWVQRLDQEQPKVVEGAESATDPFWSPDSKVIGFVSHADFRPALMRVPVEGGVRTRICELPGGFVSGAAWSPDGATIVFGTLGPITLSEVQATGGVPKVIVTQDIIKLVPKASEPISKAAYLHDPQFLPIPGRRVIVFGVSWPEASFLLKELDTGRTKLIGAGRFATYSPTGHLLFQSAAAARDLWAQPFSLETLKTTGPAFALVRNGSEPSVARDGTLVYVDPPSERLIWLNRRGERTSAVGPIVAGTFYPAVSPDGQRVAAEARENENLDVWVYDIARGARTRLSSDPATEILPVWSPAGDQIAYSSYRAGNTDILVRRADAGSDEKIIAATPASERVSDWSHDGDHILFSKEDPKTGWDLWYLTRNGAGEWRAAVLLQKRFHERVPKLSPDGRYVAYISDESGRDELYVRPFPQGERQWVVSRNGAIQPRWSRDGRKLFYVEEGTLMEVPVRTAAEFSAGAPVPLFADTGFSRSWEPNYDVSLDGEHFLVPGRSEPGKDLWIHVVQNWISEFRDKR
jgi:Tol biopolymer transport system component/DNA-binding winged helix-turn-helix (wHTH) protein